MKATLIGLIVALSLAAHVRAEVTVSAELSRTRAAADDQVVLSVTVSGNQASLPAPQLPPLQGFSLYESGQSQSLSFVNGRMSASVVHTYVLVPRKLGKFTIPPIRVAGASNPTPPLEIEVVQEAPAAPAPPPPEHSTARAGRGTTARRPPDVFITASLDKSRAYVNQQATLIVRFHYATRLLGDSRYEPPKLSGVLTEELPPVREETTLIGGRAYHVSEIKTALFPVQAGKLRIGPATVHCRVPRSSESDPFEDDFFGRFLSMNAPQTLTLNTEPLTLEVDSLPEGRPEDFTGIVGRLSAKAEVDRRETKAGEAVTLVTTLTGIGNIKSMPEPKRLEIPSARFFATESVSVVDRTGDRIGGTKTFRTVLVPRVSGEIRLPPIEFSYFDPETRSYRRTATEPITLHAAAGAATAEHSMAPPRTAPGLTDIEADIRYLKTRRSTSPLSGGLSAFASLGLWHALPAACLLAASIAAWRRRALDADPRGRRLREALSRAERLLNEASRLAEEQSSRAESLIDDAVAGYVADKLGVPASGLTLKAAIEKLKNLPAPPSIEALKRLEEIWVEADLRRFAPGAAGGKASSFAAEAAALLRTLEKELNR